MLLGTVRLLDQIPARSRDGPVESDPGTPGPPELRADIANVNVEGPSPEQGHPQSAAAEQVNQESESGGPAAEDAGGPENLEM
jgi:hypothetical protein